MPLRACVDQETAAFRRRLDVLYDPFNPDRDTTIPDYDDADKSDEAMRKLLHCVEYLMDKANFTSMSEVHIEQAIQAANHRGIRVRFDASMIDSLTLWVRGIGRTHEAGQVGAPPDRRTGEADRGLPPARRACARLKEEDDLLLKKFRNIPTADLEALLPHAQVSMNWFDRAKVAVGAGGALGSIAGGGQPRRGDRSRAWACSTCFYVLGLPFLVLGWRSFSGYRRGVEQPRQPADEEPVLPEPGVKLGGAEHDARAPLRRRRRKRRRPFYLYLLICQQHPAGTKERLGQQVERFLRDHFELHCSFDCPDAM